MRGNDVGVVLRDSHPHNLIGPVEMLHQRGCDRVGTPVQLRVAQLLPSLWNRQRRMVRQYFGGMLEDLVKPPDAGVERGVRRASALGKTIGEHRAGIDRRFCWQEYAATGTRPLLTVSL